MTTPVRNSRRREVNFIKWVALASFVLSLLQLMLGADPLILLLCIMTEGVCLWPVLLYGFDRTIGIFYLFIWISFSFTALLFKTIVLQSIDSNLFNPLLTFSIQLAGALCFSIAATIAYFFRVTHKNAIRIILDPDTLALCGRILFVIGVIGFILSHQSSERFLESQSGGDIGFFASIGIIINPLIGFGIVCETVSIIIRSKGDRTFSKISVIMMAILMSLSLLGNSKSGLLLPGLIYLTSVASFRARIRWKTIVLALVTLGFLSQFLFPAVHIARRARSREGPIALGVLTVQTVAGLMSGDSQTLAEKDALNTELAASTDSYRNLYFGQQQVWLDRFTNTGFIDAAARRMDFDGPFLGVERVVGNTFYSVLPRQLNPNKFVSVQMSSGDAILQAYGLQPEYFVGFNTVPLPVELFAAGGFGALFLIGIPLVFMVVFGINLLVFDFWKNPWSICFVIFYAQQFYAQTHDGFAFMALRQMPFDFLALTLVGVLATSLKTGFLAAGASRSTGRATTV